jgi:4-amino-4-deoxy-L-arabinose transferase-like glycosyltransferase
MNDRSLGPGAVPHSPTRAQTWALNWGVSLALLLALHVAVWTWAGVASRSNLDAPGDMVEAYVWGQSLEWGYFKHPPLSAWISGLWFTWMPEGHFGYALLTALNGAVGLAGAAVLARRLLPADWALLSVAAAAMTPGITSLAMRFNANAVLVSTWPWAMALFVKMMQDGRRRDALFCGVACALAMLGKYYSAVLLASMLVTALALPAWRRRFATPLPWIAIATLLLCLLPHLNWLLSQTEGPIQYAQSAAHESPSAATMRALHFGLSQWLFPALAFGLLAVSLQPGRRRPAMVAALTSLVRPRREAAWWLAVTPIAATMLATVATGARTASVWGLPIAAGVSVLALSRARGAGARIDLRRAACALGIAWLLVAALAPVLWLVAARLDAPSASEPREEMARQVDRLWRAEFNGPLPWVTGTRELAASVAFYADSHPRYWSAWNVAHETPWAEPERVFADGGVIVCADNDRACADIGAGWSQRRTEITAAKQVRGFSFAARRYTVYLLPPRASGQLPDGD